MSSHQFPEASQTIDTASGASLLLGRHEAFRLYLQLQALGLFPYMIQENDDQFRVGHGA